MEIKKKKMVEKKVDNLIIVEFVPIVEEVVKEEKNKEIKGLMEK